MSELSDDTRNALSGMWLSSHRGEPVFALWRDLWPEWLHGNAARLVRQCGAPYRADGMDDGVKTLRWAALAAVYAPVGAGPLLARCAADPDWADAVLTAEVLGGRFSVCALAREALREECTTDRGRP